MIFANQKSEMTYEEILKFIKEFKGYEDKIVLFPSLCYWFLYEVSGYTLGAQDVRGNNQPMTGSISTEVLKSIGGKYALVGHFERRKNSFESLELIHEKVSSLIESEIKPIVCFGEKTRGDLKNMLLEIADFKDEDIIIAYEPYWAIGNKSASPEYIDQVIIEIKKINDKALILYGGSVNENNIQELKTTKVDGFLVGGASKSAATLKEIID